MDIIEIGKIVNTRGLKGELKIMPLVDELDLFFSVDYFLVGAQREEYGIESVKAFKNNIIAVLDGIDSIDKAEALKNKSVFIYEEDLPLLDEGTYYVKDLLGLTVKTEDGEELGTVDDVFKTGSNDVYTVKKEGRRDIYLPAIKEVVKDIDLLGGVIIVRLIEGLVDEQMGEHGNEN